MSYHLETKGLTVADGEDFLLRGVDLGLSRGRVTAIVGPSGAGKTTLLRCLNGLEPRAQGTVLLDGADIETIDPINLRRRVGLVFQLPMLFEGTVRDNLLYALDAARLDPEAALTRVSLDGSYLDRRGDSLSVGEAQRVSLGRALMRDPEVLLMDEPTSALDRDSRTVIESLVRSLAGEGLTVAVVTHDLSQAERIADHAWLLVAGVVHTSGLPASLESMWEEHRW